MTEDRPCAPVVTPIGVAGGWYHVGGCPAHPSLSRTLRGRRNADTLAASHTAERRDPEPRGKTIAEAIREMSRG